MRFIPMLPSTIGIIISPAWNGEKPRPICKNTGVINGSIPLPMRPTKLPSSPSR
ncbi:hypothetical protein D3C76_1660330 [compost metagenome]